MKFYITYIANKSDDYLTSKTLDVISDSVSSYFTNIYIDHIDLILMELILTDKKGNGLCKLKRSKVIDTNERLTIYFEKSVQLILLESSDLHTIASFIFNEAISELRKISEKNKNINVQIIEIHFNEILKIWK